MTGKLIVDMYTLVATVWFVGELAGHWPAAVIAGVLSVAVYRRHK